MREIETGGNVFPPASADSKAPTGEKKEREREREAENRKEDL